MSSLFRSEEESLLQPQQQQPLTLVLLLLLSGPPSLSSSAAADEHLNPGEDRYAEGALRRGGMRSCEEELGVGPARLRRRRLGVAAEDLKQARAACRRAFPLHIANVRDDDISFATRRSPAPPLPPFWVAFNPLSSTTPRVLLPQPRSVLWSHHRRHCVTGTHPVASEYQLLQMISGFTTKGVSNRFFPFRCCRSFERRRRFPPFRVLSLFGMPALLCHPRLLCALAHPFHCLCELPA